MESINRLDNSCRILIRDDRIIGANDGFLELTGYKCEDVLFRNLNELKELLRADFMFDINLDGTWKDYVIFTKHLKARQVKISSNVDNKKDERTFIFEKPSYDDLEDLLNKKRLEYENEVKKKKELEQVLKGQEEFFSYMAHEFKTPLTVIYSAIQLLDYFCKNELTDRAKGFINKIRQSSLQQLRLVNNILDITKAESGYLKLNIRNFDIVFMTKKIVNSVLLFAQDKNIRIEFYSPFKEKYILIDDEKYERILLNILSNAIKFTPEGKSIYVDLFLDDNNNINIRVKDEGVGISPDNYKKIFERFGQADNNLTRESEGTGIGLCLAKNLASALGGDITLESEEGVGSAFTLLLPDIGTPYKVQESSFEETVADRLVQSINVEFSNIYR